MITTPIGKYTGITWEAECQLAFKFKYGADGYQQVPASPGDYGIEGFTKHTGYAFQCYCPEKQYHQDELYENQRDKINKDLVKLKKNTTELQKILGGTKIATWCFVTPEINKNKLLSYAQTKQTEVRAWGLPHLDQNFTILLHDHEFYLQEFNTLRISAGLPPCLGSPTESLPKINNFSEPYDENLARKCQLRMPGRPAKKIEDLVLLTTKSFLDHDTYFQSLYDRSPQTYVNVARIVNAFEQDVMEWGLTSNATPEHLTELVKTTLMEYLVTDRNLNIDKSTASEVVRRTIARWLAVCELDFNE
ncbi:hypothetical protein [Pseudomonas sp. MH10]|uniref:hypothetical protein n=1 Tax=Pseudomonas sp. MH10 TaxID=3048627 RepID=UPI002AC9209F|nr:hypothetical protein [Pseudomonas sp. MH10]MEB0042647.1 hypothetical protein [Pseudomonas sp. MH10]WPX63529.1 hypothetical protein RHM59_22030 [Pseudomonas sp. MH10]